MVINLFGPMVFIYLIVRFWSSDPVSFKIAAYVILTVNDLWLVVLKYSELVTLTMPVQSTSKTNTRIPDLSKKSNFYMFWDNFSVLKTWPDLQKSTNFYKLCKILWCFAFHLPTSEASKGGSKFKWKKKSTYPRIWWQRICLSVCDKRWAELGALEVLPLFRSLHRFNCKASIFIVWELKEYVTFVLSH